MTVAALWDVQVDVYSIIEAALAADSVEVFDRVPPGDQGEHCRIDGFAVADASPKNAEIGRHSFMVHYFVPNVHGQARAKQQISKIHAALMAGTVQGKKLDFEYLEVTPETTGTETHAIARYTITLK